MNQATPDWYQRESAAALTLQEQERVGRELHDVLGPQLTSISMLATSLEDRLAQANSSETALATKLLERIEQAKVDLRALTKGLIPVDVDDEGLMSALADLAHETEDSFNVGCRFECDPPVNVPDNFIATRLFRIAAEAVHNAVQHAQAGALTIRLSSGEQELVVEVQDNGIGLSEVPENSEGRGLHMMRHRCEMIGGQLNIHERATGGTSVMCCIAKQSSFDL